MLISVVLLTLQGVVWTERLDHQSITFKMIRSPNLKFQRILF